LWCSQSGDHPKNSLSKFEVHTRGKSRKRNEILLYSWLCFFFFLNSGKYCTLVTFNINWHSIKLIPIQKKNLFITNFQYHKILIHFVQNHKTVCLCKIYKLQNVKMIQKLYMCVNGVSFLLIIFLMRNMFNLYFN